MRGQYYIGILKDSPFKAEVVRLSDAVKAVVDVSTEDAAQVLKEHPIGYFSREDFTMNTPNDPSYQELKEKINTFFENNADIFQYLKENPESIVSASDLYNDPGKR